MSRGCGGRRPPEIRQIGLSGMPEESCREVDHATERVGEEAARAAGRR